MSAETDCETAIVPIERRGDQIFAVPVEELEGRAQDAAQCAAGHQARGHDDSPLTNLAALLAADLLRTLVDQVRHESAGQHRRGEPQRQVEAEGEDHGRLAQHLQHQRDHGADAEEHDRPRAGCS